MPSLLKSNKAKVYALFLVLVLSAFFGNMSQTALNAMLPNIVADFDIPMSVGQWLTTVYMLSFGIVVLLAAFLVKRFSTKNLIYLALGLSLVGLVLSMLSWNFGSLFVGRVCQAAATGILLPLMQTTAMVRFPSNRRATAMGIASIALGVAPTLGPTLGGLMDFNFGWRSFFVVLIVAMAILLALGALCVEPEKAPAQSVKFETPSFILSSLGFGCLLLSFSNASNFSLGSPFVWAPLLVGALCVFLFVRRQKRIAEPLINMDIFKSRQYTIGFIAVNSMFLSHMAAMLILSLYVQDVCGGTSLDAGLTLLPGVFAAVFLSPLAGYLADRIGIRLIALVGGIAFALGTLCFAFVDGDTPLYLTTVIQTVRSIGAAFLIGPMTTWSLVELARDKVTDGSSFALTVRQAIASLGTSFSIFVLTVAHGAYADPVVGYQMSFAFSAVFAIITLGFIVARVK